MSGALIQLPLPEHATRRKPRIVVAGEFSSGKTQLINGLLGAEVLPSNVTATALPPIWLVSGQGGLALVDKQNELTHADRLDAIRLEDTGYCILGHPSPFLQHFDVIDTPGSSDPNMPADSWEHMLPYADAIVWCTNATQAWRQSEKSIWQSMPEHLVANATLVVSHADLLPDQHAARRVQRRVGREAGAFFESILMASLLEAEDVQRVADSLKAMALGLGTPQGRSNQMVMDAVASFRNSAPVSLAARSFTARRSSRSLSDEVAVAHPKPAAAPKPQATPDPAPARAMSRPVAPPAPPTPTPTPAPVPAPAGITDEANPPADAPASSAWAEITRGVDLADNAAILRCVSLLLERLDGEFSTPSYPSTPESPTPSDPPSAAPSTLDPEPTDDPSKDSKRKTPWLFKKRRH